MFKNNFLTAFRTLYKNIGYSTINIIGLSIGIASCLTILLFVIDELSYDRYNENVDDIVRVVFNAKINGESIKEAVVMAPVGPALKNEFPEILESTRLRKTGSSKIFYKSNSFRNDRFAYVDPNFFDVFTLPILKGNKVNPLQEPNTVVITQEIALKYFGNEDPINKILEFGDQKESFTVTGIIGNVPHNSHFHFDIFGSSVNYEPAQETSWMESGFFTYLLLKKGTDYKNLESKLPPIFEKNAGPQITQAMGVSYADFTKKNEIGLFLQPLADIHLNSDFSSSSTLEQGGDKKTVYIFGAIAFFMLLIACVNFMNLSTASATKRAKEVGVRKVLGSSKKQLFSKFMMESFIAASLAMVIAIIIMIIMLPLFNSISGKALEMTFLLTPTIVISLLTLLLIITVIAGAYPATYISSFNPITALKNKFSGSSRNKGVRSGLVVFQFVISAGLIFGTLVVDKQMSFIQNKDLGYNKDQILVLRESNLLGNNQTAFKNQIISDPRVINVSNSAFVPAGATDDNMTGIFVNNQFERRMYVYNVDDQYIPTMDMKLLSGRNFSTDFGTDSLNAILNETAVKILGLEDNPIGKSFIRATNNEGGKKSYTIIGVVKDFHFRSLHQKIDPLLMFNSPYGGLLVRAKVSDMPDLVKKISGLWSNFNTGENFTYALLDDSYNQTYLEEKRMGTVLRIFALLTIFVACLGLFGLVTFTAEQRIKEIGIRKVLGSSILQIVSLLSLDFIKLVMISFFIAFPLGAYFLNKWLQDFAYRIDIHWSLYLWSGIITIFIALATISFRSIKAALANPVNSLRSE